MDQSFEFREDVSAEEEIVSEKEIAVTPHSFLPPGAEQFDLPITGQLILQVVELMSLNSAANFENIKFKPVFWGENKAPFLLRAKNTCFSEKDENFIRDMKNLRIMLVDKRNSKIIGKVFLNMVQYIINSGTVFNPTPLKDIKDSFPILKPNTDSFKTEADMIGRLSLIITCEFGGKYEIEKKIVENKSVEVERIAKARRISEVNESQVPEQPKNFDISDIIENAENLIEEINHNNSAPKEDIKLKLKIKEMEAQVEEKRNTKPTVKNLPVEIEMEMLRMQKQALTGKISKKELTAMNTQKVNELFNENSMVNRVLALNLKHIEKSETQKIRSLTPTSELNRVMINPTKESKIFRIEKQLLSKNDNQTLLTENVSINIEVIVRKGHFKINNSEEVLCGTSIDLLSLICQDEDKYLGKIPLFLVPPEVKNSKVAYKVTERLKKITINQITAKLELEASFNKNLNVKNEENKETKKFMAVFLKIHEIRGYQMQADFLKIEINGIEEEGSSGILQTLEKRQDGLNVFFEKQFLVNPDEFIQKNQKFFILKIIEKFVGNSKQKLLGYSKISCKNLQNFFIQQEFFNSESIIIEKGLFELNAPGNITKGFVSVDLEVADPIKRKSRLENPVRIDYKPQNDTESKIFEESLKIVSKGNQEDIDIEASNNASKIMRKKDFEMMDDIFRSGIHLNSDKCDQIPQNNENNFDSEKMSKFYHEKFNSSYKSSPYKECADFPSNEPVLISSTPQQLSEFELRQRMSLQTEFKDSEMLSAKVKMPYSNFKDEYNYESKYERDNFILKPKFSTFRVDNDNEKNERPFFEHFPQNIDESSSVMQMIIYFFEFLQFKKQDPEFYQNFNALCAQGELNSEELMIFLKKYKFPLSSLQINVLVKFLTQDNQINIKSIEIEKSLEKFVESKIMILITFFKDLILILKEKDLENLKNAVFSLISSKNEFSFNITHENFRELIKKHELIFSDEELSDFQLLGYFLKNKNIYLPNIFNFFILIEFFQKSDPKWDNILENKEIYSICRRNSIFYFNVETFIENATPNFLNEANDINFLKKIGSIQNFNELGVLEFHELLQEKHIFNFEITFFDSVLLFFKIFQFRNSGSRVMAHSSIYLDTFSEFIQVNQRAQKDYDDIPIFMSSNFKKSTKNEENLKNSFVIKEKEAKNLKMEEKNSMKNDIYESVISKGSQDALTNIFVSISLSVQKIKWEFLPDYFEDKIFSFAFIIPESCETFQSGTYLCSEASIGLELNYQTIWSQIIRGRCQINEFNQLEIFKNMEEILVEFKLSSGDVFAFSMLKPSEFQSEQQQSRAIIPNFSFFNKMDIFFDQPYLGEVNFTPSIQSQNKNKKEMIMENIQEKEIEFQKEIPLKGFLQINLQKLNFLEIGAKTLNKLNLPDRSSFLLSFLVEISVFEEKMSEKLFFEEFNHKNDLLAFLSTLSSYTPQIKPSSIQIAISLERDSLMNSFHFSGHIKLIIDIEDRYGTKLHESIFSHGNLDLRPIFTSFNDENVDFVSELPEIHKSTLYFSAKYTQNKAFTESIVETERNIFFVKLQPRYFISFMKNCENASSVQLHFIDGTSGSQLLGETDNLAVFEDIYFGKFPETEIPEKTLKLERINEKIKFEILFNSYGKNKIYSEKISFSLERNSIQSSKKPLSRIIMPIFINSGLIELDIWICRQSNVNHQNSQRICQNLLNFVTSKNISEIANFYPYYSKIVEKSKQFSQKNPNKKSTFIIDKKKWKVLVKLEEFMLFLKIEAKFVRSEVDAFLNCFEIEKESGLVNISMLFQTEFEHFNCILNNEQTNDVFLKELFQEIKYNDEESLAKLSFHHIRDVLKSFGLVLDNQELNMYFIEDKEDNMSLYLPFYLKLFKENKFFENSKEFKKNIQIEEKKEEILVEKEVVPQKEEKIVEEKIEHQKNREIDENVFKFLEEKEIVISTIKLCNLNQLADDKKKPNCLIKFIPSFESENHFIKTKMQPRENNPVFKNIFRFKISKIKNFQTIVGKENKVCLLFRNFNTNSQNSIQDKNVGEFSFCLDEILSDKVFQQNYKNSYFSEFSLQISKNILSLPVQIDFCIRLSTESFHNSRKVSPKPAAFSRTEDLDISNTLKTLHELKSEKKEDDSKNCEEGLFDFIKNHIQSHTFHINESSQIQLDKKPMIRQKASENNSRPKFESFGDLNANSKESSQIFPSGLIKSGDHAPSNKSNPFAECLGEEMNSFRNTKPKEPELFSIKEKKELSPSKADNSDASLRLMRKIPKTMFSEIELSRISRLINSNKISPGLFDFDSDEENDNQEENNTPFT